MTSLEPRVCRHPGCTVKVVLAQRVSTGKWAAFQARDRAPWSLEAAGALVLVGTQAWAPADLVEHFHVTQEITEEAARNLVSGHSWHQPHHHHDHEVGAE